MADPEGESSWSVLVVSDDERVQEQARFGFPADVRVGTASDAGDALARMEKERPSVVVVDLRTGNAGGFDLSRAMKQTSGLGDIPVLILLERPQDAWLARQAGAIAWRVKPLAPGEIARAAQELVPTS